MRFFEEQQRDKIPHHTQKRRRLCIGGWELQRKQAPKKDGSLCTPVSWAVNADNDLDILSFYVKKFPAHVPGNVLNTM